MNREEAVLYLEILDLSLAANHFLGVGKRQ